MRPPAAAPFLVSKDLTVKQLDPGAVIAKAFDIYKANAAVLLPIAFGVYAIQAIVSIIFAGNLVGALVGVILTTILGIIFQGIVVEVARDVEDGVLDSSVGQLVSAVIPAVVPLFLVGILAAIAIVIGFVFLIIPGLVLMTIFAVVAPVTVLERPGVLSAFSRSQQLVKGNALPVFGLIFFNFVLGVVGGIVAGIAGSGAAGGLVGWVVSALLAPLTALVIAEAYLRLREAHGEAPLPTGVATADGPLSRPGY